MIGFYSDPDERQDEAAYYWMALHGRIEAERQQDVAAAACAVEAEVPGSTAEVAQNAAGNEPGEVGYVMA